MVIIKCPRVTCEHELAELINDREIVTLNQCVETIEDLRPVFLNLSAGKIVSLYLCWRHTRRARTIMCGVLRELTMRRHDGVLRGGSGGKIRVILSNRPTRRFDPVTFAVWRAVQRCPYIQGYAVNFMAASANHSGVARLTAMTSEMSLGRSLLRLLADLKT